MKIYGICAVYYSESSNYAYNLQSCKMYKSEFIANCNLADVPQKHGDDELLNAYVTHYELEG